MGCPSSIFLVLICLNIALKQFGISASSSRRDELIFSRDYLTPTDLNVHHLIIPGNIPAKYRSFWGVGSTPTSKESILLHVSVRGSHSLIEGRPQTILKGFFFAESITNYRLTAWGEMKQARSVKLWSFPVDFTDLATGAVVRASLQSDPIWAKGRHHNYDDMWYPVPFTAILEGHVSHVLTSVSHWLHNADFMIPDSPTPLELFFQKQQSTDWAAWSILSPVRTHSKVPGVVKSLVHYINHHLKVGFSGVVLYATPQMMLLISKEANLRQFLTEGKLLCILWERFNYFSQQMFPDYSPFIHGGIFVPEKSVLNNHAVLLFSPYNRTVIWEADSDEFFVPREVKTIQGLLRAPDCIEARGNGPSLPWGAIDLQQIGFRSSALRQPENPGLGVNEMSLWQLAAPIPECNPLYTYKLATSERRIFSKMLLRPAGGISSWQIHTGTTDPGHQIYKAKEACAVMLHVFNMVNSRVPSGEFVQLEGDWKWIMTPSSDTDGGEGRKAAGNSGTGRSWAEQCIPEGSREAFNMSWRADWEV